MYQTVKIKGKPYIINWSGRGYWYCPTLDLTSKFHPNYDEESQKKAFDELIKLMREKVK